MANNIENLIDDNDRFFAALESKLLKKHKRYNDSPIENKNKIINHMCINMFKERSKKAISYLDKLLSEENPIIVVKKWHDNKGKESEYVYAKFIIHS